MSIFQLREDYNNIKMGWLRVVTVVYNLRTVGWLRDVTTIF